MQNAKHTNAHKHVHDDKPLHEEVTLDHRRGGMRSSTGMQITLTDSTYSSQPAYGARPHPQALMHATMQTPSDGG